MASFGTLPAAPLQSVLQAQAAKPLVEQIADSQKRLKGAFGDATLDPTEACLAQPVDQTRYAGKCRHCSQALAPAVPPPPAPIHKLASTLESKREAKLLFDGIKANGVGGQPANLLDTKGNMFGVLICVDNTGQTHVLKAFSGGYAGTQLYNVAGWCDPVPCANQAHHDHLHQAYDAAEQALNAFDRQIQADMATVRQKQAEVDRIGDAQQAAAAAALRPAVQPAGMPAARWQAIQATQQATQATRNQERQTALAAAQMELATAEQTFSQHHLMTSLAASAHLANLQQTRDQASAAVLADNADSRSITPFQGASRTFRNACYAETPTGVFDPNAARDFALHGKTGWCAAPKLLAEAKRLGYTPVSMTEFWMGRAAGFAEGQMISSCAHCQSFVGFALCGLEQQQRTLAQSAALNPPAPAANQPPPAGGVQPPPAGAAQPPPAGGGH